MVLVFQIITNYLFNVIIDLMRPRFTKVKTLIFEFSIGISMKKNCSRRENSDSRAQLDEAQSNLQLMIFKVSYMNTLVDN